MEESLLYMFLGCFLISLSHDIGVPREHRVKLFSKWGLLQLIISTIGIIIIYNSK